MKINLVTKDGYTYFSAEIIKKEDHYVDFNVYQINSWELDEELTEYESELYLTGSIKWDGCSHIDFKTNETMKHLCGKQSFILHCEMMISLYEKITALIPDYNKEVAE